MVLSARQESEIKQSVILAFEKVLDRIDGYDRHPSRWEEDTLVRALALMTCRRFVDAAFELRRLLETTEQKVDAGREMSRPPRTFFLTVSGLRDGLKSLRDREIDACCASDPSVPAGRL